ncbi:MAG TPA: phosphatase PAP2 family protein [Verrucomicrobiae bacterium]
MSKIKGNFSEVMTGRLRSEPALKLILLFGLNLLVYGPYLFLQRHHFFPATVMPLSSLDHLIPFSDQAVWLYFSIYLLMPIGPFLMNRRGQLLRYAAGIVLFSCVADVVFLFWPTTCPRPAMTEDNIGYQILTRLDNSFHAFPSLHAAFAVYSALCGGLVLRELGVSIFYQLGLWLWAALILYATLATKQHVVADIIAGSVLGGGAFIVAFKARIFISKDKPPLQAVDASLNQPHSTTR